jgi:hypothetical protein
VAFPDGPGENPQCAIGPARPDHTQVEAVVSHCDVLSSSPLAEVANHSYHDEWDKA